MTLVWCLADETDDYADQVLGSLDRAEAVVPSLWEFELCNGLLMAERRGRLDQAGVQRALALFEGLPIVVDCTPRARSDLVGLGRQHNLTAYDAAYLDLALREGLPMAALDLRLKAAARQAGVVQYAPP